MMTFLYISKNDINVYFVTALCESSFLINEGDYKQQHL